MTMLVEIPIDLAKQNKWVTDDVDMWLVTCPSCERSETMTTILVDAELGASVMKHNDGCADSDSSKTRTAPVDCPHKPAVFASPVGD